MRDLEPVSRVAVAVELMLGSYALALSLISSVFVLMGGLAQGLAGISWEVVALGSTGIIALIGTSVVFRFVFRGRDALRRTPAWMFVAMWIGVAMVAWAAVAMMLGEQGFRPFLLATPLAVAAIHLTIERAIARRT
ncbi:hypothetical protein LYSHEL_08190 [Lysobacter helvus]|uniref:Uncharacterized protein n=2 Tax=Lysobacteraceae TaxID=32033 RepID=A0ABM7Q3J8_9GAMM|nr:MULTISPECIES: hypothetical protein [Lysobacter]BCT91795.1 hypothetical protein LYSCAS_08190 [Lysobacter caseinilyticus]BCT94948.1 hypothetical protein LYSHEL_08190 [Lysobacter helvus]